VSPDVTAERRIAFRILAPQAQAVRLNASDIPGTGAAQLTKADNGVWEITVGPVPAGAYRYNFNIDGVATLDPRNPLTSESQNNSWSLVQVPGSEFADTRNVPHGSVAEVTYHSTALNAVRRMHVYLPPGYETNNRKYPVFYLLHGAGDSDDSWSTVGRAGFILDNLIAAKKAKPMIMVMPAGHTRGPAAGNPLAANATDAFVSDFVTDIMPYVQTHYRTSNDRANTAIAGLSMGGSQTLNIAIPNLEKFGYIGVYSSGLLGAFPGRPSWSGASGPRRCARCGARGAHRVGDAKRREACGRQSQEGAQAVLVQHGQGRFPAPDHRGVGGSLQEARLQRGLQGERRRAHVAQLARLSERVRAAVVSVSVGQRGPVHEDRRRSRRLRHRSFDEDPLGVWRDAVLAGPGVRREMKQTS
jgi:enterochelin esterase-like enzyme